MPEIQIGEETEAANHWAYAVRVLDVGQTHDLTVTLSFQDYDLWSHGRVAPSRVVEACVRYLLDQAPDQDIMPKFDCSIIRRLCPDADAQLPRML